MITWDELASGLRVEAGTCQIRSWNANNYSKIFGLIFWVLSSVKLNGTENVCFLRLSDAIARNTWT
jgi:hypothetical protein